MLQGKKESLAQIQIFERFAISVTKKFAALAAGEPEEQLRAPIERLMEEIGSALGRSVIAKGESKLPNQLGKPDYAILTDGLLAGYLELKAPGIGARFERFKGHDRKQWDRFQSSPNLLYTDGNEWGLYQGENPRLLIKLSGDITSDGKKAVTTANVIALVDLLSRFLAWEPTVPTDAKELAKTLAPLCRMLRADVIDALKKTDSAFVTMARDWRDLLFRDADDKQFADGYAQTVTYALLLARAEGTPIGDIHAAARVLQQHHHTLIARALEILTDEHLVNEVSTPINLLQRVIDKINPKTFRQYPGDDPWLYFYEDFLAAYDPKLRKDAGVYYTPVQVVQAQVRLVDKLLVSRFGCPLGFADDGVDTLDPAVGTGTYLLGIIDHSLKRVKQLEGAGAIPGKATTLANNLHGFEIMVGSYSVAELRITQALKKYGAELPADGLHVYLTDTLESPGAVAGKFPTFYAPLAKEHERARRVKQAVPILVILGNPPYDRHEAADEDNRSRTGGWVRWADKSEVPILNAFLDSARDAGYGVHIKNLYNLYVYFWRWALWKVFEHKTAKGPGVISFISASSFLDGPGFVGMREHLRRICDEIWVIDLGGEGRGARKSENVFAIQTPVAITVAARFGKPKMQTPATVHYASIEGTQEEKLDQLNSITDFTQLTWQDCSNGWQAPMRPVGTGHFHDWPLMADLFPWQLSGVQTKRSWPTGTDNQVLSNRWRALLAAENRKTAFRETRDRKIASSYLNLRNQQIHEPAIANLPSDAPTPPIVRYAYRSFDRQWLIADNRLGDFMRPQLWAIHSERQIYLTSLLTEVLGNGPALVACAEVPDLHYFRGSFGGKHVIPLWRDEEGSEANIRPQLLEILGTFYGSQVTPESFLEYSYGILAHPAYSARFSEELSKIGPRVPITKDRALFAKICNIGRKLIHLHTYGERFQLKGQTNVALSQGNARCIKAVSQHPKDYPESFSYDAETETLKVGNGEIKPVSSAIWAFEVSGLQIVASWLGYRMKDRKGKSGSPLDLIRPERWESAYTTELLKLIWILEATLSFYPMQAELLNAVVSNPVLLEKDLPLVPMEFRETPTAGRLFK